VIGPRGALAAALLGAALASAATAGAGAGAANVLWSSGVETGDISEWLFNGGGPYITRSGRVSVERRVVHSGRYAMRLSIRGADGRHGDQAIRMFRYRLVEGSRLPLAAYYSVWLYFPVRATPRHYWNVIQWKTKLSSGVVVPVFILNVANRASSGAMYLYLLQARGRLSVAASRLDLPVRRWVQIETYYRWSTRGEGRVTVWQDGHRVMDLRRAVTAFPTDDVNPRQWSVNNYTNAIRPSTISIFVDDAAITRRRLGPTEWPGESTWVR
jgi:Polysaccharide lyase